MIVDHLSDVSPGAIVEPDRFGMHFSPAAAYLSGKVGSCTATGLVLASTALSWSGAFLLLCWFAITILLGCHVLQPIACQHLESLVEMYACDAFSVKKQISIPCLHAEIGHIHSSLILQEVKPGSAQMTMRPVFR